MSSREEQTMFDAIADRLGEHPQATNYELADSGEYETKLRGPVDVEVLAEWLTPTVKRAQAEAWTSGHIAGRDYQGDGWNADNHDPRTDNPYIDIEADEAAP